MTIDLTPIQALCHRHGLPWDDQRAQRLTLYIELLQKFSRTMNLIGPMSTQDIVRELILDSLIPATTPVAFEGAMIDVGTGAGLPGIPLKILFPDLALTLIEPRRKRVTFMGIAIKRLGLEQVEIFEERIEELALPPQDIAISKAFQPPPQWLATAQELVRKLGGHVLCMTREREVPAMNEVAPQLGLTLVHQTECQPATRDGVDDRVVVLWRAESAS